MCIRDSCKAATMVLDDMMCQAFGPTGFSDFVAGLRLRSYTWSRRTDLAPAALQSVTLAVSAPEAFADQMIYGTALSDGVAIARDLVNEATNHLGLSLIHI